MATETERKATISRRAVMRTAAWAVPAVAVAAAAPLAAASDKQTLSITGSCPNGLLSNTGRFTIHATGGVKAPQTLQFTSLLTINSSNWTFDTHGAAGVSISSTGLVTISQNLTSDLIIDVTAKGTTVSAGALLTLSTVSGASHPAAGQVTLTHLVVVNACAAI